MDTTTTTTTTAASTGRMGTLQALRALGGIVHLAAAHPAHPGLAQLGTFADAERARVAFTGDVDKALIVDLHRRVLNTGVLYEVTANLA